MPSGYRAASSGSGAACSARPCGDAITSRSCSRQACDASRTPAAGADRLIAVAVSHAVGGAEGLLQVLDDLLVPDGLALVGDGVWLEEPDDWCRGVFGDLPSPEGLVQLAAHTGFEVADVDRSTTQEWDEFEGTWTDAVEAVGTPEARDFAASRREEYQRYRGVLGFTWLLLRRP